MRMEDAVAFSDAHCHLDLFDDAEKVIYDSRMRGVGIIITAGSNASSNVRMLELAKEGVYGVVGISPDFSGSNYEQIAELMDLVKMNKNIIGIGEIGLDETILEAVGMERQVDAFTKQIAVAKELGFPVVVHARKAIGKVMEILEKEEVERAVFHFFEGDEEMAKRAERRGYIISMPPGESGRRKRVIKSIELSSIVAETDSPAVGKTPADVVDVVNYIATIKGLSLDETAERITKTIKEYFYI